MDKEVINICYAADENYAMQAGVSICSVLEHNREERFHFWILCDNYSEKTRKKFSEIENLYDTKVDLIDVTSKLIQLKESSLYVPEAVDKRGLITFMYARLFIGSLLPRYVSRLIYIDCDTYINGKIGPLFDFPLIKIVGAVIDLYPSLYNKIIGFSKDDKYYNSGVLLIDMDKWRNVEIEKQICNHISSLKKTYYMHDQDILNVVLKTEIEPLPLMYNMMYISRAYNAGQILKFSEKTQSTYYDNQSIENAKKAPIIIHYAGDYFGKPWDFPKSNDYALMWEHIFLKSPWKNEKCRILSKKIIVKQRLHEILEPVIHDYWLGRTYRRFVNEIRNINK